MKKYRIKSISLPKQEYSQLQAIGVDVDVEIVLKEDNKSPHLCFITVDNSVFCLRKSTMKNIELEEVKE